MTIKLTPIFFALAAIAVLTGPSGAGAQPVQETKDTGMTKNEGFFKQLDSLLKAESFKPEEVGKALGLPLAFKKTAGNEAFDMLDARGPKGAAIQRVELRLKRDGTRGSKVLLHLSPSSEITADEVRKRFGSDPFVQSAGAHAPKGTPTYYVYSNPGGELRFGLAFGKSSRLVRVIVDRGESVQSE